MALFMEQGSLNSATASLRLQRKSPLKLRQSPQGHFSIANTLRVLGVLVNRSMSPFIHRHLVCGSSPSAMLEPGSTVLVVLLGSRTRPFSGGKVKYFRFSLRVHMLQDQAEGPNKNMLSNKPTSLCASIWKMALRASYNTEG